jgi:nicotinamide-nucleotide amidase
MDHSTKTFITTLRKKKLTLALAESMTCGLAAHKLSNVVGTSDVLKGGITCYTPEIKIKVLGISIKIIEAYTCESQEVTNALAKNLRKLIKADICAAITGLASPGGSETKDKPVGTVFLSFFYKGKVYAQKKILKGTPTEIKRKACRKLYHFILLHL